MGAFAANSLLTRAGIERGGIGPMEFALVRVAGGAAMLGLLLALRRQALPLRGRAVGALSLATYMLGFSAAYLTLDAGLGALVLFGVVQVSLFALAAMRGEALGGRRVAGALVAFGGLVALLWPGGSAAVDPVGAALMVAAGLGWAAYTAAGRGAPDALAATAASFLLCLPMAAIAALVLGAGAWGASGVALALVSGAVTSGLGYALWYALLPRIASTTAAVVQLSVPVIALAAGALLLGEALGLRILLAGAVVLGGIVLALTAPKAPAGRSRSRG
ncbi:DMT family transporter [Vannielia litorea]|uniref:DMT family transporter n=1 Tax=Vannielia litorea TaxID=1217970 RepID=UPI0031408C7C